MITQILLRHLAVQALLGTTLAQTNVWDSRVAKIEDIAGEQGEVPIVVAYSDGYSNTIEQGAGPRHELVIECALARIVKSSEAGVSTSEAAQAQLKPILTDALLDLRVAYLSAQIVGALQSADNAWAQLLLKLTASKPMKFSIKRGASNESGAVFAARQLVFEFQTIAEPVQSMPATGVFADCLSALENNPDSVIFASYIANWFNAGEKADWVAAIERLETTTNGGALLGLGPNLETVDLPETEWPLGFEISFN
ncbi:hypothetical protein [Maritalea porphyrae]|uniref:hypothetical protein n=1 Tax=Maritalea porphyrae TaxID=880732 RepID=UPI0022B05BE0|nr:hypothetical protein [Maritalea porphyrae]MCZ4273995.1 hypothetical protein [Maritalea porphyrae]